MPNTFMNNSEDAVNYYGMVQNRLRTDLCNFRRY